MSRFYQIVFVVLVLVLLVMVAQSISKGKVSTIKQSELQDYIRNGDVKSIEILDASSEFRGEWIVERDESTRFIAQVHPEAVDELIDLMNLHRVQYENVRPGLMDTIFSPSAMLLMMFIAIPIVFIIWMMNRQMQGGGGGNQAMNFGKSRARLASDSKQKVTFSDVAGVDEAVEELNEVVDFLRNPKKYEKMGAEIPKGVLLIGPPGCGKTHLAKAVAGEANVPFFYISGSDFVEMFVGVGASRVRDLFDQAKRRAPCLVFIDELDAVGRHRGTGIGGTHDEREQTLNQMLVEMDGFEPNSGIIVLAATNRPDVLDPALLRPGRFDRRITVDSPDLAGRKGILDIYIKNKPLVPNVDLEELAQRTPGFSGADLKNVVNEAALLAARGNAQKVDSEHLYEAVERVIAGPERKSRVINESEKKIIAYHELGHAIVAYAEGTDPVHKISILPRGQALGYTLQFPDEDRFLVSKNQMLDRISVALGGRAAEKLVFDDITTGAQNDLQRSTDMARSMVTKYGMSSRLGPIQFGSQSENPFLGRSITEDRNYSNEVAMRIDDEVHEIITESYDRATDILKNHREKMDDMAELLIKKESLERVEFEAFMEGREVPVQTSHNDSKPPANDAAIPNSEVESSDILSDDADSEPAPAG